MYHCYVIIYDLRVPGRNYNNLYNAIKSYGTWGKLTESAWAIVTSDNHVQVRDYLMRYINSNDRIMVIKSGQEAAWNNIIANKDWLKENLIK